MTEEFAELVRYAVLEYLGLVDGGEDARHGLLAFLESGNRSVGSDDFLVLLDACLMLAAEQAFDPPWAQRNVYGFADLGEGDSHPIPKTAVVVRDAFDTLYLNDAVIAVIRELPSNRLGELREEQLPQMMEVFPLYYDGTFCWVFNEILDGVITPAS